MSEPLKHHYLPVFYLKSWSGEDGQLCRFEVPFGTQLKHKRVAPAATGFERNLYSFETGDGTDVRNLETELMSRLDNDASIAFAALNKCEIPHQESSSRKSWAQFLVSQLLRTPEDIGLLKALVDEEWSKSETGLQQKYDKLRGANDPECVSDFIQEYYPRQKSELAATIAEQILVHPGIVTEFSRLEWRILEFPQDAYPLLTSDRPVWSTATIFNQDDFLWIPIGPKKLFVASNNTMTLDRLSKRPRKQFGKIINMLIAQHAVRFVYSIDADMFVFVEKHFATKKHSSLLERLAARWRLNVQTMNFLI